MTILTCFHVLPVCKREAANSVSSLDVLAPPSVHHVHHMRLMLSSSPGQYIHSFTHMHIHTCTYTHAYTHIHTHTCTYTHTHTHTHTLVAAPRCSTLSSKASGLLTHTYMYVHKHARTHTHPWPLPGVALSRLRHQACVGPSPKSSQSVRGCWEVCEAHCQAWGRVGTQRGGYGRSCWLYTRWVMLGDV
jgi:hypothetical protein